MGSSGRPRLGIARARPTARITPRAGSEGSLGNGVLAVTSGRRAWVGAPRGAGRCSLRQGACQHATPAAARDVGETEERESLPWCAMATGCGLAPHPVVYQARQVRDQVVGDAVLFDAAGEHDQNVASPIGGKDDGGVVVHDLADACARAAPTRSIRMFVARLLERVIIRSSRSRTARFRPTRAYRVESESSSLPTTNAPSTREGKAVCTVSESSSPSSPVSASRKIWIITGSFMVLAAWNRRFAPIRIESARARDR